jgi:GT2 family glycosyltransferase
MISVVIPSYNRRDCILNLLRDVYAQEGCAFEVIVVDDCSSDDTVQTVRREFPQVTLLVNENNGGPCVSRNRGIHAAKGRIIVGFDSDVTVPDRNLLSKVHAAFTESPEVSGFAFRIFAPDDHGDDAPRWWHPVPIRCGRDRCFETDYFSGTAYAFRKETMISAGLYPEILYMHYEEVELALRILDHGGSIIYRPDFGVVHHANPISRRSEIKVFYKPRNQVLLALRCYPFLRGLLYLTPRLACGVLQGLRHQALGDWCRAMRSAHELAPFCLTSRKPLQRSVWKRIATMKRQHDGLSPVLKCSTK